MAAWFTRNASITKSWTTGAQAASPLLFPETVFNAPASHLAAILGITGASYTLVGDGAVGIAGAENGGRPDAKPEPSIVVWSSARKKPTGCSATRSIAGVCCAMPPPVEVFSATPRGLVLSEGAGAVVIDRTGSTAIEKIDAGNNFSRQREAAARVSEIFDRLGAAKDDLVIASANGTFVDRAERTAILEHCPDARVYAPKAALGEGVGAGGLWQVICAAQALRTQHLAANSASGAGSCAALERPRAGRSRGGTRARLQLRSQPTSRRFDAAARLKAQAQRGAASPFFRASASIFHAACMCSKASSKRPRLLSALDKLRWASA